MSSKREEGDRGQETGVREEGDRGQEAGVRKKGEGVSLRPIGAYAPEGGREVVVRVDRDRTWSAALGMINFALHKADPDGNFRLAKIIRRKKVIEFRYVFMEG